MERADGPQLSAERCLQNAVSALARDRVKRRYAPDPPLQVSSRVRGEIGPSAQYDSIVALIFWGRARYTSILQPYLERELVQRGGVVDEIWLCMATHSIVDLHDGRAWAAANPAVRAFDVGSKKSSGSRMLCFDEVLQNHSRKLFIKIDDDIIYIRAGALAYLAARSHGIVDMVEFIEQEM